MQISVNGVPFPFAGNGALFKVAARSTGPIADLGACPVLQDGVTLDINDLFLVNDGASPDGVVVASDVYNGVYIIAAVAAGNATLVRVAGATTAAELAGSLVFVEGGAAWKGRFFGLAMRPAEITVGVTEIRWDTLTIPPHDVDIYVDDVAGDDADPGTPTRPVQTMAQAFALVPACWTGHCRIHDANATGGTYEWPVDVVVGKPIAGGEPVLVQGVLVDAGPSVGAPAFGPLAITALSGGGPGTQIILAALDPVKLTNDQLAGRWLRFASGARAGQRYLIATNAYAGPGATNQMLTLENGAWAADLPVPGDLCEIVTPATIIETPGDAIGTTWPTGTAIADQCLALHDCRVLLITTLGLLGATHVYLDTTRIELDTGGNAYVHVDGAQVGAGCLPALLPGAFGDLVPSSGIDETAGGIALEASSGGSLYWVADAGSVTWVATSTLRGAAQVSGQLGSAMTWAATDARSSLSPVFNVFGIANLGSWAAPVSIVATTDPAGCGLAVQGQAANCWCNQTEFRGHHGVQPMLGAQVWMGLVTGSGLTGFGVHASDGAKVGCFGCTVSGTSGDVSLDDVGATWAEAASGLETEIGTYLQAGSPDMQPNPAMKVRAMATASIANLAACPVLQDGVTLIENDLLFVNDGASPDGIVAVSDIYNGPYRVGTVAAGVAPLTRWFGAVTAKRLCGSQIIVESGTTHRGHVYELQMSAAEITVNVTPLKWTERGTVVPGDVFVYVDAVGGNDANPGTATRPVQTLVRALALVPPAWSGKCRVVLQTAGTYTLPATLVTGCPVGPLAEPMCLQGLMTTVVSGTITARGATPGATNKEDITDGALAMTPDDATGAGYAGYFLRFTSGVRVGERYTIGTNDATTCTLLSGSLAGGVGRPNLGDTFVVEKPAAIVATPVVTGVNAMFDDVVVCLYAVELSLSSTSLSTNRSHVTAQHCWVTSTVNARQLSLQDARFYVSALSGEYAGRFADLSWTPMWYGTGLRVTGVGSSGISIASSFSTAVMLRGLVLRGAAWVSCGGYYTISTCDIRTTMAGYIIAGTSPGKSAIGTTLLSPNIVLTTSTGPVISLFGIGDHSVSNVDIRGGTTGIEVYRNATLRTTAVTSSAGALVGGYGIDVSQGGRVILDAATTITGTLGDFRVDKTLLGTYTADAVAGIIGPDGSYLSRGTPVNTAGRARAKVRGATIAVVADLRAFAVANDGITFVENDLVFVKDTASPDGGVTPASNVYNGVYKVGAVAVGVAPLTRWYGAKVAIDLAGCEVEACAGTANAGRRWHLPVDPSGFVVDVTAQPWVEVYGSVRAGVLRKSLDVPATNWGAGTTTVVATYVLAAGAQTFLPSHWVIPATTGPANEVYCGIRWTFSDGSTVTVENNVAADVTYQRDAYDFNKDGLAITQVELVVRNTDGGSAHNTDPGIFYLHGFVV